MLRLVAYVVTQKLGGHYWVKRVDHDNKTLCILNDSKRTFQKFIVPPPKSSQNEDEWNLFVSYELVDEIESLELIKKPEAVAMIERMRRGNRVPVQSCFVAKFMNRTQSEVEESLKRTASGLLASAAVTEDVLFAIDKIDFTPLKLSCLKPDTPLNDDVMNGWLNLLMTRDSVKGQADRNWKPSRVMNTFFMKKLIAPDTLYKYDFKNVESWFQDDVNAYNKILFPIHHSFHWMLVVVFVSDKKIRFYDSLERKDNVTKMKFCEAALYWLSNVFKMSSSNKEFVESEWEISAEVPCPKQGSWQNGGDFYVGVDCGLFVCVNAAFVIDDFDLRNDTYNQGLLISQNFRLSMCMDLFRGSLLF